MGEYIYLDDLEFVLNARKYNISDYERLNMDGVEPFTTEDMNRLLANTIWIGNMDDDES